MICQESKQTVGIDIDKEGVNYLKKRGYDARVEDAQNFDLGEKFDVIVAGDVVEHLTNFDGFLKSVKKHLKNNSKFSKFIITTPNVFFFRRTIKIILEGKPPVNPEHTCWFDEETLTQLLRRYGFRIDRIFYTSGELRFRILPLPIKIRSTTLIVISELISSQGDLS